LNTQPNLAKWAIVTICISTILGVTPLWGKGDSKAVDDYNFAAWLYNTGKHEMAIESYEGFLKHYPDHEKQADARFGLAQSHFHLGAFAKAAQQYDDIRAKHPDFAQRAEVLFQLGQSRVALEQFKDAEGLFKEVSENHDEHYLADWAIARRAACLTSLGRNAEAEALLAPFAEKYTAQKGSVSDLPATKAMLQKVDNAGVKAGAAFLSLIERSAFTLGLAQFNQEHFGDAAAQFKQFQAQYPDSALRDEAGFRLAQSWYRQDAFAEAAAAYASIASGTGEFAAAASFEQALALYKAGNLKEASDRFAEMTTRFPDDERSPKAALYAGTFRYEAKDYTGTISRLEPLIEGKATFADEASYWVSMALFKLGKLDEAKQAFEKAISTYPRSKLSGDMKLGLADVQLASNDLKAAAAAFKDYANSNRKAEQAPRALYSSAVALHRADAFTESDKTCADFLARYNKDALVPDVLFLSGENRFLEDDHSGAATRYRDFLTRKDTAGERIARTHFRLAWIDRAAKRYDDALKEIEEIDRKQAGAVVTGEAHYLAGVCHFELGSYTKAIDEITAYLKTKDHSRFGDDALFKVGTAWHRKGEPKQSIQALKRLVKDYGKSELLAHAQFMLAERYSEIKDYNQAVKHYRAVSVREDAGELAPHALFGLGIASYDQEQWNESATAFAVLQKQFPASDLIPQAQYRRARALMNLSNWKDAAATFAAMIQDSPKHELARSAQVNVAACFQELKQWDDAAKAHDAAINNYAAGDDQARLYYELAWSHREAGRLDAALKAFRGLAEEFPKDPLAADAFFHLAEDAYKAQDSAKLDEARGFYEKVLEVSQDKRLMDKALYRIGWCRWQQAQYTESAKAFDRLIDACPQSELLPDALFQSGLSHAHNGDKELAEERMARLTSEATFEDFAYHADALLALSDHRLALANPTAALESLDTYLATYAEHHDVPRAQLLKGKALYALKRYADAMTSLETCTGLTRSATAAEAQFYIGQTYQIQSNYKDALVAYLRVQALYSGEKEWGGAATFESAKCYDALGKPGEATAALKDVVSQYKDTRWAKLAADRLK
jgi:cellulose synthase operon protein C